MMMILNFCHFCYFVFITIIINNSRTCKIILQEIIRIIQGLTVLTTFKVP